MSSFQVVPAELTSASGLIGSAAGVLNGAEAAAASAQGMAGAFGGEPIEGAFVSACGRAAQAILALTTTVGTLAGCVQAAAEGYLVTDHGIIRAGGVRGRGESQQGGGLPTRWRRPGAGHDRRGCVAGGRHRAVPRSAQGLAGGDPQRGATACAWPPRTCSRLTARWAWPPDCWAAGRVRRRWPTTRACEGWPRSSTAGWPACTRWPARCAHYASALDRRSRGSSACGRLRRRGAPGPSGGRAWSAGLDAAMPSAEQVRAQTPGRPDHGRGRAGQTAVDRGQRLRAPRPAAARRLPPRGRTRGRASSSRFDMQLYGGTARAPDRRARARLRGGQRRWTASERAGAVERRHPARAARAPRPVDVRPDHGRGADGQRGGHHGRAAPARRCCSGTASARAAAWWAGSRAASAAPPVWPRRSPADGSIGSAAVGVVEAAPGLGSYRLGRSGAEAVHAGTIAHDPAAITAGQTRRRSAASSTVSGGTASSRGWASWPTVGSRPMSPPARSIRPPDAASRPSSARSRPSWPGPACLAAAERASSGRGAVCAPGCMIPGAAVPWRVS